MNMNEIQILSGWKDKAGGWRWLHYHSMVHYKKINARFVYTSIILSTLAGAGGFSTAGQKNDDSLMGQVQFYMAYVIGITNVIIGLLNSFQRFGKAAEKTELHANAAMQYSMLQRTLETELSLNNDHRSSDLVPRIRQELDRLLSQSPPIPYKIVQEYNRTFPNSENVPDVCAELKINDSQPSTPTQFVRRRIESIVKNISGESRESLDNFNQPRIENPDV
jgi:hypothetical protein